MKNPAQIIPGAFFTGKIERLTTHEKVPLTNQVKRGKKPEAFTLNTAGSKYTSGA